MACGKEKKETVKEEKRELKSMMKKKAPAKKKGK